MFLEPLITSFLALIFSSPQKSSFVNPNVSPVIFVPGNGESQLEAKLNKDHRPHFFCYEHTDDYYDIYFNLVQLLPGEFDCWCDNMKLHYNNQTRKSDNPGVDIRVKGWGDPTAVENIDAKRTPDGDYFNHIGDMLVNELGYVRNVSLRGAPYDFRRGPAENEEFFVKLKTLIEETYELNNKQRVTLIVHSMGGPMSLIFLNRQSQSWKDQHIKSVISLAAAWGGSMKTVQIFAVGDDLGFPLVVNPTKMKKLLTTFPSLGFLLPNKLFWKSDDVIVETETRKYTFADMQQYLIDIGSEQGWEFQRDNEHYLENFTAPGVEVHCLHGVEVPTVEKLTYQFEVTDDDPSTVTFARGDGDGVVNLRSLEACTRWIGKQPQKVTQQTFPGVDHRKILEDRGVIDYIKKVMEASTLLPLVRRAAV